MKTTSDSIDIFDTESSATEVDYEAYDKESDSITVGSQTFAATKAYGIEEEPEPEDDPTTVIINPDEPLPDSNDQDAPE